MNTWLGIAYVLVELRLSFWWSLAYPTHPPYLLLARNLSLSGFATDLERPVPGDRAFLGKESGLGLVPDEPSLCLS